MKVHASNRRVFCHAGHSKLFTVVEFLLKQTQFGLQINFIQLNQNLKKVSSPNYLLSYSELNIMLEISTCEG